MSLPVPDEEEDLASVARSRIGQRLRDKYRIDQVLGIGGMATVYAATHRNGRRVAVKILHPELSLRSGLRGRFIREGHAANAVQHPGVVAVIDDDIAEDGTAFIVMELLQGRVLERVWEESGRRLPPQLVLALTYALCDVLEAAHKVGIIHRDIKPENLFLTEDGNLKVLDFGLARVRDALHAKRTKSGYLLGTPAFMAPEQARGRANQIDEQTDIWATGATMFTLLSGHTVHDGESAQHVMFLAATDRPRSLREVMPDAPQPLINLVDHALAMVKEHRWPNATAMKAGIVKTSLAAYGEPLQDLTTICDLTQVNRRAHTKKRVAGSTTQDDEEPAGEDAATDWDLKTTGSVKAVDAVETDDTNTDLRGDTVRPPAALDPEDMPTTVGSSLQNHPSESESIFNDTTEPRVQDPADIPTTVKRPSIKDPPAPRLVPVLVGDDDDSRVVNVHSNITPPRPPFAQAGAVQVAAAAQFTAPPTPTNNVAIGSLAPAPPSRPVPSRLVLLVLAMLSCVAIGIMIALALFTP